MDKKQILLIIVIMIFFTALIVFVVSLAIEQTDAVERCKDNGYDGIRTSFTGTNECFSYTQAERIAIGINKYNDVLGEQHE